MPRQSVRRAAGAATRRPEPKRWAKKLTRRIVVRKGPRDWLLSLDDARTYLLRHFWTANPGPELERAVDLLVRAADSGRLADREAATKQFERILKARNWL